MNFLNWDRPLFQVKIVLGIITLLIVMMMSYTPLNTALPHKEGFSTYGYDSTVHYNHHCHNQD